MKPPIQMYRLSYGMGRSYIREVAEIFTSRADSVTRVNLRIELYQSLYHEEPKSVHDEVQSPQDIDDAYGRSNIGHVLRLFKRAGFKEM